MSTTSGEPPKTIIDFAEWPRDAPSALERNVITIICGNSRLHWALHEGCLNKFIPIVFWHTSNDDEEDENEGSYQDEDPCDVLEAHIASQAHTIVFGDSENKGCIQTVSETAAKRDAPGISVYVVSSNPREEKKICYMFRDVPAKLFKLRNCDFFTPKQGLYPTMGVDRAAALYGAKHHFGAPVLVIDGGTAMTYTALDKNGHIIGGGISPGVKVRLQSLADYTGSLPVIDHQKFKSMVDKAIESKTPLPFFATNTEMAMISPVCGELACQLRNIAKQFVRKCQSNASDQQSLTDTSSSEQKKLPIIVTGGDGKFLADLLKDDASGIVPLEPDASPTPENVDVKGVKNLVTYAIGDLINEKYSEKALDPDEKLRLKIQGLRIAMAGIVHSEVFSRGCVFKITPTAIIEGYTFHARFDNGVRKNLSLRELYESLVLYNEIGEKSTATGAGKGEDEDWVKEKKIWSAKVQEELGNVSRSIRIRIRELRPFVEKGEVQALFRKRSIQKPSPKKMKRSLVNPREPIGKRIAKFFPVEHSSDGTNTPSHDIFFGTVKYISDFQSNWYFVVYDDGDAEDICLEEVLAGFNLYTKTRHNDTMAEPSDNSTCLPTEINIPVNEISRSRKRQSVVEEVNLPKLLATSSNGNQDENSRQISEFKEDIM